MGWEQLDQPPKWVIDAAGEERGKLADGNLNKPLIGNSRIYHGDTYVYKVEFTNKNHGHHFLYYRQLKSDYFETTTEEGTCPNCQAYIKRYDDDLYLTCHRCGWQYKSWFERLMGKLF